MAVEQLIKILALEEKPSPNPITLNLHNPGNSVEGGVAKDFSHEKRLARIRAAQDAQMLQPGQPTLERGSEPR
jgi:hypothetical protein